MAPRAYQSLSLVALTLLVGAWAVTQRVEPQALPGWRTYDRYCAACHGTAGDGHGPAAPYARVAPRAFTTGEYQWRSTPLGQPPTDDDLRTTIRHGAPGTSMPAFALDDRELEDVIAVLEAFAPDSFQVPSREVTLGAPPPPDPARGAELWTKLCGACHGTGHDDGPSAFALAMRPYPLASTPLRRPRDADDLDARRHAAVRSIATGLAGTPMPGFAGAVPDADLWALADHVVELGAAVSAGPTALPERNITADRGAPILIGTWPGTGADEVPIFGAPLAPQGMPPATLTPAQASLHVEQCARCHAKQFREWRPSVHAGAGSPGLIAQLDYELTPEASASCQRCHGPLAEQRTDPSLRAEGVSCAGCHVRGWTRHGPPVVAPSLLPISGYPLTTLAIYERGDFCIGCHQLPPRTAVNGKPLLDTYREWLEGPYMRRGVQCQHCHMPNREHVVLGVHDKATFRQGIEVTADARRTAGGVRVDAAVRNIGAGHDLPTTPTPAAWLRVELLDARGAVLPGGRAELRIGRDIYYDHGWKDRSDTRIPPGERIVLAHAWSGGRSAEAVAARITVEVHPDDYYERFYAERLARKLAPVQRALYEKAQAQARSSYYIAEQRDVAIRGAAR